jgi:hypothetical protein
VPVCLERRNFLGVSLSHERARFQQKKKEEEEGIHALMIEFFCFFLLSRPIVHGRMLLFAEYMYMKEQGAHSGLFGSSPDKLAGQK